MNLVSTATWLAISRTVLGVAAFGIPVLLARVLAQSDFGAYKQVPLAASLLTPLLVLGFDKSLTYFVPRSGADRRREVSTPVLTLLIGGIGMVLVLVAVPGLLTPFLGTAAERLVVATMAVYGLAAALDVVAPRALVAAGYGGDAAVVPVAVGVPRVALLVGGVLLWPRVETVMVLLLTTALGSTLAWTFVLARRRLLGLQFRPKTLWSHFTYGGVLHVVGIIQSWAGAVDRYLVSSLLGPATYGVYAVGTTTVPVVPAFARALSDATAPVYSKLESDNRYVEMVRLMRRSIDTVFPLGLLLSMMLSTTAHWTVPMVYGPSYADAVPIFQVAAFYILLKSIVGMDWILRAMAALGFLLVVNLASLALRLGAGVMALSWGGLQALIITQFVLACVMIVIRLAYMRLRLPVLWRDFLPGRGIRVSVAPAVVGLVSTIALDRLLGDRPWWALSGALAIWGALIAVTLHRQGLLQEIRAKLQSPVLRSGSSR